MMFGEDVGMERRKLTFCISSRNSGTCNSVLLIAEHDLKTLPGYEELLEV